MSLSVQTFRCMGMSFVSPLILLLETATAMHSLVKSPDGTVYTGFLDYAELTHCGCMFLPLDQLRVLSQAIVRDLVAANKKQFEDTGTFCEFGPLNLLVLPAPCVCPCPGPCSFPCPCLCSFLSPLSFPMFMPMRMPIIPLDAVDAVTRVANEQPKEWCCVTASQHTIAYSCSGQWDYSPQFNVDGRKSRWTVL